MINLFVKFLEVTLLYVTCILSIYHITFFIAYLQSRCTYRCYLCLTISYIRTNSCIIVIIQLHFNKLFTFSLVCMRIKIIPVSQYNLKINLYILRIFCFYERMIKTIFGKQTIFAIRNTKQCVKQTKYATRHTKCATNRQNLSILHQPCFYILTELFIFFFADITKLYFLKL